MGETGGEEAHDPRERGVTSNTTSTMRHNVAVWKEEGRLCVCVCAEWARRGNGRGGGRGCVWCGVSFVPHAGATSSYAAPLDSSRTTARSTTLANHPKRVDMLLLVPLARGFLPRRTPDPTFFFENGEKEQKAAERENRLGLEQLQQAWQTEEKPKWSFCPLQNTLRSSLLGGRRRRGCYNIISCGARGFVHYSIKRRRQDIIHDTPPLSLARCLALSLSRMFSASPRVSRFLFTCRRCG